MPASQSQPLPESAEQVTADKGLQSELNANGKRSVHTPLNIPWSPVGEL